MDPKSSLHVTSDYERISLDYRDMSRKILFNTFRFSIDDPLKKNKVVLTPETMVTSLAVDWVHDDLYWVCQQRSAVEAASMDGQNHTVIAKHNDTSKPAHWHSIVVDPYVR